MRYFLRLTTALFLGMVQTTNVDAAPLPREQETERHVEQSSLLLTGEWSGHGATYRIHQRAHEIWIDGKNWRAVGHVRSDGRIVVYWQTTDLDQSGFLPAVYVLVGDTLIGSYGTHLRVEVHDGVLIGGGSADQMIRAKWR